MRYAVSLAGCLIALTAVFAPAGPPAAAPLPMDSVPAAWTKLTIVWKGNWAQTLEANPEATWAAEINKDPALRGARGAITLLRRIELLKAMIARFPADKDKHVEAYQSIADAYGKLRSHWWRAYYLRTLAREFPKRRDVVVAAYEKMLDASFDVGVKRPSMHVWRAAMWDVLELNKSGVIANDHPVVATALKHLVRTLLGEVPFDYDSFARFESHVSRLSGRLPEADKAMGEMLTGVGHHRLAAAACGRAKIRQAFHIVARGPSGEIGGLQRNLELDTRWEALKRDPMLVAQPAARAAVLQEILDTSARAGALRRETPRHYVSFWNAADEALRDLPVENLAALGRAQDQAVKHLLAEIRRTGDHQELTRLARRYPWARGVHELLIELGERDLRAGRRQWAYASFRDASMHAWDPDLKRQAAAGLWLTMTQDSLPKADLAAAMSAIKDQAQLPWRGGTISAGPLKKHLLAGAGADAQPPRLTTQLRRKKELPPTWAPPPTPGHLAVEEHYHASWPVVSVQVLGSSTLLVGPRQIARYGPGPKPTWVQTAPAPAPRPTDPTPRAFAATHDWWMTLTRRPLQVRQLTTSDSGDQQLGGPPAAFYCLWGPAPSETVAAFDARSGKQLWSTRGRDRWHSLRVLTHPVAVDGGIYVLAADTRTTPPMLLLACLDTTDGHLRWEQRIGAPDGATVDLAVGGCGLSVHRGAVYCSTNMGIAARCDVRDGTVEWVTGYSGAPATGRHAMQRTREGSPPIVVGRRVLVAPRDHTGLLALDRNTGKVLWETPLVPSDKLLGVSDRLLIATTHHRLAAIDTATGKVRWSRTFPEGTGARALLAGGNITLLSGNTQHRIAAATGKSLQTQRARRSPTTETILLPDGSVLNIVGPPLPTPVAAAMPGTPATPLKLKDVWSIPCERPQIVTPRDGAPQDGKAFWVLTKRQAACVQLSPAPQTTWTHTLDHQGRGGRIIGGRLIVRTGDALTVLDATTGAELWSVDPGFRPYDIEGDDKTIAIATGHNAWEPHVAAIEAASGKVLWSRPLADRVRLRPDADIYGLRFRKSHFAQGLRFRRPAGGPASISLFLPVMFGRPPGGFQLGEVTFDEATGKISRITHALPNHGGVPIAAAIAPDLIGYIGRDLRAAAVQRTEPANRTLSWRRGVDMAATEVYPWAVWMRVTDTAAYAAAFGHVFFFDVATQKETTVRLPPTPDGKTLQAVLDARRIAQTLVVVSGHKARYLRRRERSELAMRWDPIPRKIFVDVFSLPDGKHLGRRELPNVRCSPSYRMDYDTQARILPAAILIADPTAVHIFPTTTSGLRG